MEEPVLTVFFNECKPIILNATNRKTLKKVTDTSYIEEMAGKRIQLTTKRIKAFGEFHDAIRITTNQPADIAQAKPIDIGACKVRLGKSTTLVELQTAWETLTPAEKNVAEIITEKERLKGILK